jgi:hypothetical protein
VHQEIPRSIESQSFVRFLQADNVHLLFSIFAAFVLLFGFVIEYLHSILCVYVTRATPDSRRSHQITYKQSAVSVERKWGIMNTHCMAFITILTSTVSKGIAVVAPIRASCKAVLYLLMVVGCTSADGSEKSQYLENVLGGGNEIHR